MFIFIKDFVTEEIDDFSNILITDIDFMGNLEQLKRFDRKTNHDNKRWIQDGYFKITELNDYTRRFGIRRRINVIDLT